MLKKELSFNPPIFKFMKHRGQIYKIIGHSWLGFAEIPTQETKQLHYKEYTEKDLRDLEIKNLKRTLLGEQPLKPKYIAHNFMIKKNTINLVLFKFWTGEEEIITLLNDEFRIDKHGIVRVNDEVNIIYRDGILCSTDFKLTEVTTDRSERLMKDLTINATGQQQKDFSRIRTDYSHVEVMKEKDIEAEEKKEQAKRYG